jgi:hypothetical protein
MHDNWYENSIHKIIQECWNVAVQALHRVKIKRITFTACYWRKKRAVAALNWSTRKAKGSPPKKSTAVEKERQAPKFAVVADIDEDVHESELGVQITSPCDCAKVPEC